MNNKVCLPNNGRSIGTYVERATLVAQGACYNRDKASRPAQGVCAPGVRSLCLSPTPSLSLPLTLSQSVSRRLPLLRALPAGCNVTGLLNSL